MRVHPHGVRSHRISHITLAYVYTYLRISWLHLAAAWSWQDGSRFFEEKEKNGMSRFASAFFPLFFLGCTVSALCQKCTKSRKYQYFNRKCPYIWKFSPAAPKWLRFFIFLVEFCHWAKMAPLFYFPLFSFSSGKSNFINKHSADTTSTRKKKLGNLPKNSSFLSRVSNGLNLALET